MNAVAMSGPPPGSFKPVGRVDLGNGLLQVHRQFAKLAHFLRDGLVNADFGLIFGHGECGQSG